MDFAATAAYLAAMLRRLLVLLLALGLMVPALAAVPAAAAASGHCAPAAATMHHRAPDRPAPPAAKHDCIGCIAPFADPTPRLALADRRQPAPAVPAFAPLGSRALMPDLPPPRG